MNWLNVVLTVLSSANMVGDIVKNTAMESKAKKLYDKIDEREKEIRNDLVQKVVDRISPMALDKISLFYNVHKIDEIIADKVYITVMNYVVSHNDLIGRDQANNE